MDHHRFLDHHPALEGLNAAQYEAVTYLGGPLSVLAGAGSGKTRVLTHRIAHLIDTHGVSPYEILAITFTNKAAEEMKHRVRALVGSVASGMWVSTFHSACLRILRRESEYLDYPSDFTIYDRGDSTRLCKYVLGDLGIDTKRLTPRKMQVRISALKNDGITAEQYAELTNNSFQRRLAEVFLEYQRRLVANAAMDFDDLLQRTVELFRDHDEVLDRWGGRFKHVLVDEYQDTNKVQNQLVVQLAVKTGQITVVGDSDQSIYAFRGADVRNLLEFEAAFPDTHVIMLEQNYRSTKTILEAANAVIAHNNSRRPKNLWSDLGPGKPILFYHADDEQDEARFVIDEMIHRNERDRVDWGDMAVLYRTNAQSRVLEDHLVSRGIPYRIVGGTRFYDRQEVRDAVAYLKVVANPNDEVSVKRVLNVPKRGVGAASVSKVAAYASAHELPFFDALRFCRDAGVSPRAAKGIHRFCDLIDSAAQLVDDMWEVDDAWEEHVSARVVLTRLLEDSGYRDELLREDSIKAHERLENLAELEGVADQHETVAGFLEAVALMTDTDILPSPDGDEDSGKEFNSKVTLMTLHAAKGLEYLEVYLTGLEDGVFPHYLSINDMQQMEEERRLAYVGITRAMERLTFTCARKRQLYGHTRMNLPSCFLSEIPESLMKFANGRRMSGYRNSRRAYAVYS